MVTLLALRHIIRVEWFVVDIFKLQNGSGGFFGHFAENSVGLDEDVGDIEWLFQNFFKEG